MITEIDFPEAFSVNVEDYKTIHFGDIGRYLKAAKKSGIGFEYWKCAKDKYEIRLEKNADRTEFMKALRL